MTDLAVWDWCLTGLMTAEHPLDTHRHTIQECRHTSDTYARADTGAGIARMDRRSHINWEVWKLVWTHTFSLEHRLSLTCVVCVFGLPAGQNESWLIICFWTRMISLQSGLRKFGWRPNRIGDSLVSSPRMTSSNLFVPESSASKRHRSFNVTY